MKHRDNSYLSQKERAHYQRFFIKDVLARLGGLGQHQEVPVRS